MKQEVQEQIIVQVKSMSDTEVFRMLQEKLFNARLRISPLRFFLRHFKSEGAYETDSEDLQGLGELISDHIKLLDEIALIAEMGPHKKLIH